MLIVEYSSNRRTSATARFFRRYRREAPWGDERDAKPFGYQLPERFARDVHVPEQLVALCCPAGDPSFQDRYVPVADGEKPALRQPGQALPSVQDDHAGPLVGYTVQGFELQAFE